MVQLEGTFKDKLQLPEQKLKLFNDRIVQTFLEY